MAFKLYNFYLTKDLPYMIPIDRSGMTVSEMFDYLSDELGSTIKETALVDGNFALRTKVAIDGHQVNDIHTVIPDGAEVVMAFIIPGG